MYCYGLAIPLSFIYKAWPSLVKIDLSWNEAIRAGFETRESLCANVLYQFVAEMLEDMLENNTTFVLPTKTKKSTIHMKKMDGECLQDMIKRGSAKHLDLLRANFTTYRPYLFLNDGRLRSVPIHTLTKYTNRLDEKVNEGKKYC